MTQRRFEHPLHEVNAIGLLCRDIGGTGAESWGMFRLLMHNALISSWRRGNDRDNYAAPVCVDA